MDLCNDQSRGAKFKVTIKKLDAYLNLEYDFICRDAAQEYVFIEPLIKSRLLSFAFPYSTVPVHSVCFGYMRGANKLRN